MTRTTFLFLLLCAGHNQGSAPTLNVAGVSGGSLWLQPPALPRAPLKVNWYRQSPAQQFVRIVSWDSEPAETDASQVSGGGYHFSSENFSLQILEVEKACGGLYELEITERSGQKAKMKFNLSVFDMIRTPSLQVKYGARNASHCLANLSCSTTGNDPVAYSWYPQAKPKTLIGNSTRLVLVLNVADHPETFACNVSNPVAWAQAEITIQCPRQASWFIPTLALTAATAATLLCLLGCFLVRKKRRKKRTEDAPATLEQTLTNSLTVYEEVRDDALRMNKRRSSQRGGQDDVTIYSVVHLQTQDTLLPTSNPECTLYSSIQNPKHAPKSKQRTPNPPLSATIYQEVGWTRPSTLGASRLSCKELEAFHIYN
ncbi:natural killer cell receptor 2B4-like [Tachyglossus aculeatus]|uniref:natural killer cell receptor 2B4-like n=1 Tax=Tachyglossus aculeatus TaxID=9261 RepID=UPI0018F43256|nr:natural killer cell receptor 2B4-like [Tachyglossus aculeatus]